MRSPIQTAVILAAGSGRRMWPYGDLRPKAILPVLNQPLIARMIDDLAAAGVARIVVVTGHHGQRVIHALSGRTGVAFVRQEKPEGTAPALLRALPLVEEDAFLVVEGDLLLDRTDLRRLLEAFAAGDSAMAALVRPIEQEDSRDWICASVQEGGLAAVEGHPREGDFRLCGVLAMHRRALRYIQDNPGLVEHVQVGGMPPIEAGLAASLQMAIEDGEAIPAVVSDGLYVDLDKPWHILEANERAIAARAKELSGVVAGRDARISDGADIHGPVLLEDGAEIGPRTVVAGPLWVGAGTRIDNGPILGPGVVVGPHSTLANYCQIGGGTTVGPRNVIDHCAEFAGVSMDRVYLYHYMEFWGVLGSAVDLGAATVCGNLRFDDARTVHNVLGHLETPRVAANAAYVGDYCRTGVNAVLMPGVKVGSYSCVGPGVVAYEDIPARTLVLAQQELVKKPWGPERYGW